MNRRFTGPIHFSTRGVKREAGQGAQTVQLYTPSRRDAFKMKAPIGICQEDNTAFRTSLGQIGESFQHLSKHINFYFTQKVKTAVPISSSGIDSRLQELGRREKRKSKGTVMASIALDNKVQVEALMAAEAVEFTTESPKLYPGLELFHMSSIATQFGESYSYVANHINSVFSGRVRAFLATPCRKTHKSSRDVNEELLHGEFKASYGKVESWEEGYLHFARHINKYFGAKVTDSKASVGSQDQAGAYHGAETQYLKSKSTGLFHMSNITTGFGASYAHTANHINYYFKGQKALENDLERDHMDCTTASEQSILQEKPLSFKHLLLHPATSMTGLFSNYLGTRSKSHEDQAASAPVTSQSMLEKVLVGQRQAEEMTRVLVRRFHQATTPTSILICTEELNKHLLSHPMCKTLVWERAVLTHLLKHLLEKDNAELQKAIRETMALIGYMEPVKGRGIRVLSIDGGGTRGVVPLQVLRQLEEKIGKRVHQIFDYVCGVSTGAVLAFMLAVSHFSLDECEEMYHRFGSDVFQQNPFIGTMKMGWTHSYYNTETWENILKVKLGDRVLIKTARSELCPKVSAVSAVVNWGTCPKAFVFRNYNHAPGQLSRYAGGSAYQLWQAVRASSAAPGYFEEFLLHSDIHQDGGLILNNPSAVAIHECRLLWPNEPFQCVLSLGTGFYDNDRRGTATSTSLRAKISNLISSATDTQGVHTLLHDLLPPNVYFRFNPTMSADVSLDESRSGALEQLKADAQMYLERNKVKMDHLCTALSSERTAVDKAKDWVTKRAWELQHNWGRLDHHN
ncbi:calcium-independent phospholipase A2-gamma-like [Denticeps clupeoides]|uniref:PNPLA domain-containing protein n=1 Tax=Denticeps clupeoides TaxID=299321 RepID=A0AAY4E9V8_9TELE|nr:calcium-independent phospholipase A2-gamma-like [Denticeps clupeoides]